MLSSYTGTELDAAVIGSLLLRLDARHELPARFNRAVFVNEIAQRAFTAIEKLTRSHKQVDVTLVANEARFDGPQTQWLRDAVHLGTTNSIAPYAEKLLERHRRSALRDMLSKAATQLGQDTQVEEVIGDLVARLMDVESGDGPETETLRDAALQFIDHLENKTKTTMVIRTGFPHLDRVMKIRRGNLVVIAAQAGTGKSTYAVNIAENIAKAGGHVLIHSLEMDTLEVVGRVIARNASVNVDRLFDDVDLQKHEADRAVEAIERVAKGEGLPFHLNTRRYSLGEIVRITEKMHRKHGLALAVIDYLQLVDVPLGKNATDEMRIGTASRALKQLAQKLNIPIIAVAQLNREISKREKEDGPPPVPKLSDLRGSGRIEQDANIVAFLHSIEGGLYRLTISKQRLGRRSATVNLVAQLNHAQFIESGTQEAL